MSGVTLAQAATRALLDELATTPKPGLVDLEHTGAHRDLCVARLRDSAFALEDVFGEIARTARGALPSIALREEIGAIGRRGERVMLRASGGTNTHRGALWALGLLVAAASNGAGPLDARTLATRAGSLATFADRFGGVTHTNGNVVARRYGVGGARAQATAGFPHVVHLALPLLRRGVARADVLLALLAHLGDTCVFHRGGYAAARFARDGARSALRLGGTSSVPGLARTRALDAALVARNVSPGGCADLLAAALFLHAVAE